MEGPNSKPPADGEPPEPGQSDAIEPIQRAAVGSLRKSFRICALCRHLQVLEQGREFPNMADTEFTVFRCAVLGWKTREDYLMDSEPRRSFEKQEAFDCPHWSGYDAG